MDNEAISTTPPDDEQGTENEPLVKVPPSSSPDEEAIARDHSITPELVKETRGSGLFRQIQAYRGPLPLPEHLAGYEHVVPGAAERILKLTEKNQAHRHAIERRAIALDERNADREDRIVALDESESAGEQRLEERAQNFAFALALAALVLTGILIVTGNPVAGSLIFSATLASIVASFLKRRKREVNGDEPADEAEPPAEPEPTGGAKPGRGP